MTKVEELTIKQQVFNTKFVNSPSIDKIYRYKDYGNREYITNFSITDITIKEGKIDSITFRKDGEERTFNLVSTDVIRYIYENSNSDYINMLPAGATGEQLLGANSLLYLVVMLIIEELGLIVEEEAKKPAKKGSSKKKTQKTTKKKTKKTNK